MTVSQVETLAAGVAATATALDEDGFRAFHERTARALWAYLCRSTGSPETADDLLQESYLRLLRSNARFESDDHRRHYLFRIATNLAHDHRRRRGTLPLTAGEATSPEARSADAADRLDGRTDLRRALERLKPRDRQLLWLAYAEGATHAEIARILALRPLGVRVLLFRARRRLRKLLG